jgi:hypothetical protein
MGIDRPPTGRTIDRDWAMESTNTNENSHLSCVLSNYWLQLSIILELIGVRLFNPCCLLREFVSYEELESFQILWRHAPQFSFRHILTSISSEALLGSVGNLLNASDQAMADHGMQTPMLCLVIALYETQIRITALRVTRRSHVCQRSASFHPASWPNRSASLAF